MTNQSTKPGFAQRSPEESLALYAQGPDELEIALTGLSEADFALARAPGEWSIRAIVHHLADADTLFLPGMKMALAESGCTYHPNWPSSNEVVSENLNYAGRPVRPSVTLFRVIHRHILELAQHVPDAWERYIQYPDGPKRSFGFYIQLVTSHALEHIDEILEIRRIHNV